jgi:hypothetical protein
MRSQRRASTDASTETVNKTEKSTRFARSLAALAVAAGSGGFPACADHVPVPTAIASCPCTSGSVCCASGVCAANQSACAEATQALSESVKGEWSGYLENFQLSTDDSIDISITVAPDGTLSGQVVLGKDTPPAPATDPDAPWPPSLGPAQGIIATPVLLPRYIPGFAYDARNIRWEAGRLRFDISQYEAWQPWCALQQSYPTGSGAFNCIPGNGGVGTEPDATGPQMCYAEDGAGNVIAPVACFKLGLFCGGGGPCSCDATACNARADFFYSFDIALRDGMGDGSNSLSGGNLRLTQSSQ